MDNTGKPFSIRSTIGQEALALIRGRDQAFPHVGGTAAIETVMKDIEPFGERRILEVGCALGSTADYIRTHGWGQVTSIDPDPSHIVYANGRYPGGNYLCCEAADAPKALEPGFELVVSINAFYRMDDQPAALRGLSHVTTPGSLLRIFDYIDRGSYAQKPIEEAHMPLFPKPLRLEAIERLLEENGWHFYSARPLHQQFRIWHEEFVQQTIDHKASLLKFFKATGFEPEPTYTHLLNIARQIYQAIAEGRLGGAIIMGSAKNGPQP